MTRLRAMLVLALAILPPALIAVWWGELTAPGARLPALASLLYLGMPVVLLWALLALILRLRPAASTPDASTPAATAPSATAPNTPPPQARERSARSVAAALLGATFALALTAAIFVIAPPTMRVQFDETSLVGVAHNMHTQRQALMTTGAIPFAGEVLPLENTVDKRPPLFPFLVSVVHDLTGERLENAFAVNAALLAFGLWLVFLAVHRRLGLVAACAAPLLVAAVPLTAIVATSAGFELLNTVLFLLVVLLALDFVRAPDSRRWVALLGAGMVFAQARYESLLALALLLAVVVPMTWRRWRPTFGAWLMTACCPTLLTPLFLLLQHAQNQKFYPEAGGRDLVAMAHLFDHAPAFLAAWFDPALANPLPGLLAIVGALAVTVRLAKGRASRVDLVTAGPVLFVTVVALLWFYGDVGEPTALRLFLPFAWLTALLPLLAVARSGRSTALLVLALATGLALLRGNAVRRGESFPQLAVAGVTISIDEVLRRLPGEPETTLFVTTAAQHLIVKGHAALCPRSFAQRGHDVQQLQRRGDLRTIYVLETPIDAAMAAEFGDPSALLRERPSDAIARAVGPQPVTVYRLR